MNMFESNPAPCAVIYQSELDFVSRCILDRPDIETGGQLFGFWTARGVPVVLYAIGPGPQANHQLTFFNQDVEYLKLVGNLLLERFGLQHIGEWHSHHQLGLAEPSGHDAQTMASSIAHLGLGRFLMGLGNCTPSETVFNAFEFAEARGVNYRHLPWNVKNGKSPMRRAVEEDAELATLIRVPKTALPSQGEIFTVEKALTQWKEQQQHV